MEKLVDFAIGQAATAAREYLTVHNLKADSGALADCLRAILKIRLPQALNEVREAMDLRMDKVAQATFVASMRLAGIEAAKEAGFPISL